jgi:hypothetical protein
MPYHPLSQADGGILPVENIMCYFVHEVNLRSAALHGGELSSLGPFKPVFA